MTNKSLEEQVLEAEGKVGGVITTRPESPKPPEAPKPFGPPEAPRREFFVSPPPVIQYTPASLEKASQVSGLSSRTIDIIATTPEELRTPSQRATWERIKDVLEEGKPEERPRRDIFGSFVGALEERRRELEAFAEPKELDEVPEKPKEVSRVPEEQEKPEEKTVAEAAEAVGVSEKVATRLLEQPEDILTPSQEKTKEKLQQELGEIPPERGITGKVTDTLREALTFGKVETETFDRGDIEEKYDIARVEVERTFEEAKTEAENQGKVVTETAEQYVDRVLPTKNEYVQTILAAQPQLTAIAKEVGLASIPGYGTIRTWEEAPTWGKALGIGTDVAFFLPIIGQASAASRAGTTFARTAGNITIAELKAPFTTLRHPIQTAKAALEPIETVFSPRKIPIESLEVSTHTIRIPVKPGAGKTPFTIKAPTGVVSVEEAMRIREQLTQAAVRGEVARVPLGTIGEIELTVPALQRVTTPAAVTSSPDVRNFMVGLTVGEQGGSSLFLAPGRMERFIQATASGLRELPLSEKAAAAQRLGTLPDTPTAGSVIIRDPDLLSQLRDSGKLWQKGAEIETTLPPGTKIPPPSQVLYTRGPTGERTAILVVGQPYSPLEIAKLKLVGATETLRSIFTPGPGRFTPYSDELTQAARHAKEAEDLYSQAQTTRTAGLIDQAVDLERRADLDLLRADEVFSRANLRAAVADIAVHPVASYTGDQDVVEALQTLGQPVSVQPSLERPEVVTRIEEPIAVPEAREVRLPVEEEVELVPSAIEEERVPPPGEEPERPPPPPEEDRLPPRVEREEPPPPEPVVVVPPPGEPRRGRLLLPKGKPEEREIQELRTRAPGLTWKQGKIWIALYPPYTEDDIVLNPMRKPVNTVPVKGPKQAWERIRQQGYEIEPQTYDEWAAWFTPEEDRPSVSVAIPLSLQVPEEPTGLPLATRREFWWSE